MELNEIVQIISTVGFPIVIALILLTYLRDESANHKNEVDSLKDALNANTIAITELRDVVRELRGND